MTTYTRTNLGNEAALNPDSPLPRKLRTLLIAIDGRTTLQVYVNSLSSFGDVESLMDSLLQAGLIEVVTSHRPVEIDAVDVAAENFFAKQQRVAWSDTDNSGSSAAQKRGAPSMQTRLGMQDPVDDVQSWSKFQQPPSAAPSRYTPPGASSTSTAQYQLRNAISLMSDFVTQHMPLESLELVLTLEGLTSAEQVIGSLKGYQSLIEHLGQPARDHLAKLRTLLASA
jgi:hypothetical protein